MCGGLLLSLGLGLLGIAGGARAADLTFNRAYQGTFSGQTFTTTTLLNADPGSIRFSDGGTQRAFQNTSGTLYYSIGGVQYAEAGELNSRFPNGNTLMDAVEFTKSNGPARLLVLGGTYTTSTAYSGSSNAIVAKLNEYVDATAPDPAQTTLLVNGSSSATVAIGSSATIVVTVKLTSGAAVSGATVSLQASPTGTSTYSPSSASTNSSGQATFTVQGTASGAVTYKAVASSGGTSGVSTNSVTVTFVGTRNAQQSTATVPAGVAGSATTITVTVKDSGGGLVTGAAGGLAATIGGTNTGIVPGAISEQGSGLYTFSYVPTTAGTDSIAITLDGSAISGSPYSSVVSAPPMAITTTSLPTPVIGVAYNQTVATSGGTAPVTFAVTTGALPAGLSLNAATGAITGTPTTAGAYSFTITATDANSLTDDQSYSGTIGAGVTITTTSLPTPVIGVAYNQTVATSGGTAPVTFAVTTGALPAGLSLNAATGAITGTPTTAGAYSFTITATDANSLTDDQSYSGTIAAPPPEAVEISADVAATEIESGTSVSFDLANLVKGAFDDIRIVAPPSHGRLVQEGGNQARSSGGAQRIGVTSASASPAASSARVVTYQPNPGYTGPDSFQFVATGPGGDSNVATVSINVRGEAPAARSFSATAIDGQTLSFDLTAGLTGPFSRAVIDQVAPAAAADARIVETSADGARGYRLDMAMAQGFGGTVVVTYRLGNAVGLSAQATVTVVVTPRPDPSADPSIRAISEAQAQATQRFSRAQVDNFMRRAESLHGVPCAAASMRVRLNVPISSDQPPGEGLPGRPQDGSGASSAKSVNGGASPSNDDHEQRGCDEVKVSMWVGGALDVGRRDERRDRAGLKITSQGLSMGADAEIAPGLRMGLGLGLGKDRVSANGDADVDGDSWSMAAYGSFTPGGSLFIDGVVAQGWVDFDTRRLADNAMRAVGEREGRFSTAALAVGVEYISGAMQWSVYGRAQTLYSRLDSYTEQGAELYNLRFDARRLRSVSSVLGFRAGSSQVLPIGVLMSGIRAEWRHEFAEGGNEGLDYADRAGPSLYHFDTAGWLSDEFLVSPTLDLTLTNDWRIALEAGLRGGGGEWILSPRLQIRRAF